VSSSSTSTVDPYASAKTSAKTRDALIAALDAED